MKHPQRTEKKGEREKYNESKIFYLPELIHKSKIVIFDKTTLMGK